MPHHQCVRGLERWDVSHDKCNGIEFMDCNFAFWTTIFYTCLSVMGVMANGSKRITLAHNFCQKPKGYVYIMLPIQKRFNDVILC